jgi:hypothetical protein
MHTALTYWPNGGLGLEHGPLVYSLRVKDDWSPVVTPKWSTQEYPEWNVKPSALWNYGIAVEERQVLNLGRIERKPVPKDPWIEPPIFLTLPLKKIPGWELRSDPKHQDRKQTPPLPEIDQDLFTALQKVEVERLALVPYGATHLRVTIFPSAAPDDT